MSQSTQNPPSGGPMIESDAEFFSKSGPLPLHWADVRQFPRFYLRSRTDAVVYPLKSEPVATPESCPVLTCDISRGGMSLLHAQQVYPGQRIDVTLANGVMHQLKVVWCRRLGKSRYSAGTQFVHPHDDATETASDE